MLVPSDAVHQADGPTAWVLQVVDGRAQRQPVRIGLRSGGWSEVLDGLAPGALVVPAGVADVVDGERVRTRTDSANPA